MSADPLECCFNLDGIGDGWFQCGVCGKCERRFKNTGARYSGERAARGWLWRNGYTSGVSYGNHPIGIAKGLGQPPEWRDMTEEQRNALDGRITWGGGDPRTADALVELTEAP